MAGWTIASLAGSAYATGVTVTKYAVIQPIDVCATNGASGGCAPFNTSSQSPDPSTATATTPIGWVDSSTNINLTREMWLQAGIDVTFLPMLQYNNTTYQSIDVNCSSNCTVLGSNAFHALTTSPGPAAASGCLSNCLVPIYLPTYAFANANAIPMFFVNSITPTSPLTGTYFGFGWVNGAGVAVGKLTFFPGGINPIPRFDTMAHEIGHNLGLDHCTFGAGAAFAGVSPNCPTTTTPVPCPPLISSTGGVPNPGGCNVMNDGGVRILARSTGCTMQMTSSTTSNGGELYDLNTGTFLSAGLCPQTVGNVTIADALVPTQTTQALMSGFLNTQPNVSATAGGGSTIVATTAGGGSAAATSTASCSCPISPPPGVQTFCVTNSSDQDIAALLLSIPDTFNFTSPVFQIVCGPAPALPPPPPAPGQPVATAQVLHGNTGAGNNNCQKALPISSDPSFQCLEIDFPVIEQPVGTFTSTFPPGATFVFSTDIHTTSPGGLASLGQLECASGMPPQFPQQCLDITEVFVNTYATTSYFSQDGNAAGSQTTLDPFVLPTIVNPAFFPTLASLSPPPTFNGTPNSVTGGPPAPCTPNLKNGKCPKLAGGNPFGGD
jgi:hypothetical protein